MDSTLNRKTLRNQEGAALIFIAFALLAFLAFAALALDVGHLVLTKNEIQNAADAGALAAARELYINQGIAINPDCNITAVTVAQMHASDSNILDDINVTINDVDRGHWSFQNRQFTVNTSTEIVPLWGVSTEELDLNTDFINAVRVRVHRRGADSVTAWFARIFGFENFVQRAEAIAYIGFAGSLLPGEADQPIAICRQSILYTDAEGDEVYQCNIGRMLNSGSNTATSNTGGWTNFSQPCETASVPTLRPLICGSGNPNPIQYGEGIGSVGGVQDNIFRDLETCWRNAADSDGNGSPDTTWELTLPVIDCPGNNVSNCATMVGAVTVKVVWVQRDNPGYRQAPREMNDPETGVDWPTAEDRGMLVQDLAPYFVGGGPSDTFPAFPAGTTVGAVFDLNTEDSGRVRWASFVRRFNLRNVGPGNTAPFATFAFKSIYFLPSCRVHEPVGTTGGTNYGVLARIPVLVQ